MNGLILKAAGKKKKWLKKQEVESGTDSEEDLTSDDEFDVSQDVVYTLYNNRYIPIKYLGRGTFSRVWLTYDITENRLVGMKIIFKQYAEEASDEIKRCNKINNIGKNDQDFRLCYLFDNFIHKSGDICLIFELLGASMMSIIDHFDGVIPLDSVKLIMKDILLGIDTLHNLRLIHTDLKPENILTNIHTRGTLFYKDIFEKNNNFSEIYCKLITESLPEDYSNFNSAKKKRVKRNIKIKAAKQLCNHIKDIVTKLVDDAHNKFDNENNQVTDLSKDELHFDVDVDLDEDHGNESGDDENDSNSDNEYYTFNDYQKEILLDEEELIKNIRVKIIDFGNCEEFDKKIQDEISVRSYRPPENFMNSDFNEKADMWTIGCLLFEFLTGEYLFEIDSDCSQNERDRRYLYEMFKILGKMPRDMCLNCEFTDDLFDNKGRILKMRNVDCTSISEILVDNFNYEPEVSQELEKIMLLFLEYNIKERISAKNALNLQWLN
jgi:serine/threonine-protein kinase SRPK3